MQNWTEGQKCRLIPVERTHLSHRVRWLNDPEVQATLNFDYPLSLAKTQKWFDKIITDPTRRDFTVASKDALIGIAGALNIDYRSRKAELYCTIGEKSYWGRGIATEVYQLLTRYAFMELGLRRLYIYTNSDAAARIMDKLGWTLEGTLRQDIWSHGHYVDRRIYSLLKSDLDALT